MCRQMLEESLIGTEQGSRAGGAGAYAQQGRQGVPSEHV